MRINGTLILSDDQHMSMLTCMLSMLSADDGEMSMLSKDEDLLTHNMLMLDKGTYLNTMLSKSDDDKKIDFHAESPFF